MTNILDRVPGFRNLDERERAALVDLQALQSYARETLVFIKGDPADSLYVIVRGDVCLEQTSRRVVGPSGLIGLNGAFQTGGRRLVTARVTSEIAQLLRIPFTDIRGLQRQLVEGFLQYYYDGHPVS